MVAGMGALAEQPSRPLRVCDDDLAHYEYVSRTFLSNLC